MAFYPVFVFFVAGFFFVNAHGQQKREEVRALEKRAFECKALSEACRGVPTCCGELKCYWENGYSAFSDGYCVECIDRGQTCQSDSQCCEPLVCQKGGVGYVDGTCDVRLANGAECHEDDNCESENCEKRWYQIYGTCQD